MSSIKFYSYSEQIDNLIENGLCIKDKEYAKKWLECEGYYSLIKGYSRYFKKRGRYFKDTKFEEICCLYRFDKNLNYILYKYISAIENNIKTLLAYCFSEKYGINHNNYLINDNFSMEKEKYVKKLFTVCKSTINQGCDIKSSAFKEYIKHHMDKYGFVPLWVLLKSLTFGSVSKFLSLMKQEDIEELANKYHLDAKNFVNMIRILVLFRNVIVHGEILFSAKLSRARLSNSLRIYTNMSIPINDFGDPKYGRSDFLALLIAMKYFLQDADMKTMIESIKSEYDILKEKVNGTALGIIEYKMGFNIGSWKKLHIINR